MPLLLIKHGQVVQKPVRTNPELKVTESGLKVNDQLVAYETRFLAVRLIKYVWSHHCALKAKV